MQGRWEFPGGKLELNESPEQCLRREILEELHIDIVLGEYLGSQSSHRNEAHINLHAFIVNEWNGEMSLTDHDQMIWLSVNELDNVAWCDADIPFVEMMKSRLD